MGIPNVYYHQAMRSTSHAALGDEDFFAAQKQRSYFEAIESVARLLRAATAMLNKFKEDSTTAEASLKSLVKISLWGNRWGLSILGGGLFPKVVQSLPA